MTKQSWDLTWGSINWKASKDEILNIVESLIDVGADVNVQNEDGQTALMLAALNGYTEVVKKLIEAGADVNVQEKDGMTALMLAACDGHMEIVKMLIDAGADVNVQEKDGMTALMYAGGRPKMTVENIGAKERLEYQNGDDWTMVLAKIATHVYVEGSLANAENRRIEIAKALIAAGANVNVQTDQGLTALMFSIHGTHTKITNILLDAGADVNIQTEDGWTALMLVAESGDTETAKVLITYGADVDMQQKNGDTALLIAARKGYSQLVKILKNPDMISYNPSHQKKTTPLSENQKKLIKKLIFHFIFLLIPIYGAYFLFGPVRGVIGRSILIIFLLWWVYKALKIAYFIDKSK